MIRTAYSIELRKMVLEALADGMRVCEASRTFGVKSKTISRWKRIGGIPVNARHQKVKKTKDYQIELQENLQKLLAKLPIPNQIEAKNLSSRWGIETAINYAKVILSPEYFSPTKNRQRPRSNYRRN